MTILWNRLALIAALLCLELLALAVAYQILTSVECQATGSEGACDLLRSFVARAVSVLAAFALVVWARPLTLQRLLQRIEANTDGQAWRLLHAAGVAAMFAPLVMAGGGDLGAIFDLALAPWLAGALAASVGALFWLAPPAAWLGWLREDRYAPLGVLAIAFLIPDLAKLAQPLWDWSALTRATFAAVYVVLRAFGAEPVSSPADYVIGVDDFFVQVAQPCSGVEGFALVTGFTLLYAYLFRAQTRFPRFWLVVIPLGIVLSWVLNVLRIAGLVAIGAHVSPVLAVNGFHSYAGWMFFTLLALALLYGVQATPWLQTDERPPVVRPLRDDWAAACILPFVAFMLAGLAASTLAPQPELAYPVKVAAILAALAFFRPAYGGLDMASGRSPANEAWVGIGDRTQARPAGTFQLGQIFKLLIWLKNRTYLSVNARYTTPVPGHGLSMTTGRGEAIIRRSYDWSLDPVAVGAGVIVGLAWIATRPAIGAADVALAAALADLGALAFGLWATTRLIGTVLLVPVVEELFFRGYVLARLDRGGRAARLLAIAVSSALFALLHERWLAGGAAGVVFALVLLRRGRITDAIVAHAAANLIVALWAIASGDWGAI